MPPSPCQTDGGVATSNRLFATWMIALASIGDPDGTRAVGSIILLLIALGLALVMVAVWLFKSTRPDPELLAPLEVMGERRWRRADPVWQRRRLDDLRPDGAAPLEPSVAPPDVDEAFDQGPVASGFDDLHADQPEIVPTDPVVDSPTPDSAPVDSPTPEALPRPVIDELPGREIDPQLLATAMADLEAELGERPASERSSPGDPG
jgi:hypothetical protein